MGESVFTEADLAYLRANFATLDELCAGRAESARDVRELIERRRLPQPSYVLPDGTGMFPGDYFQLVDDAGGIERLREHFAARHRRASLANGASPDELERDWDAYLDGTYGVCLRDVTPETIVCKAVLVSSLCELLVLARPRDPEWRGELREQVAELDALEREFAPDYDRDVSRFGRPPTRDLIIAAARERFPTTIPARAEPAIPTGCGRTR